ncbi:MAG TPA: 1-(5-phosphoribosyl)-5-[(5-phosphoribosylamino)methylideneamino]imidazole-4-carboxamide isomerase [Chitinophagaceae bacterium]|nr:1-(5-phosphoribosyl)-5-[(5-phosphoribosylamino)methylideneamino]imidazole-4-carboxamide isomerase [Chitinophagaceae bacterium]
MTIIPAIDIIEGNCVRLEQGDYKKITVYHKNPLDVARQFEDAGLKRLHLVDLDGAKAGAVKNWKVLETIAGKTNLLIDFGGGIKTEKDVQIVFDSGATLATVGSIATENEKEFENWIQKFSAAKFFLGADVKNEKIAIHGWQTITEIGIYDFIKKYLDKKIRQIFCTDVNKDGKLQGPSLDLYKKILERFPDLYFVASGGISSLKDLEELSNIGCSAAIVGKAIYENKISLNELELFNSNNQ